VTKSRQNPTCPTLPIPSQYFTFYTPSSTPSTSHFVIINSCSTPMFVFITLQSFFFVVLINVAHMYKIHSSTSQIIIQLSFPFPLVCPKASLALFSMLSLLFYCPGEFLVESCPVLPPLYPVALSPLLPLLVDKLTPFSNATDELSHLRPLKLYHEVPVLSLPSICRPRDCTLNILCNTAETEDRCDLLPPDSPVVVV
jgi:hypothetical protein